VVHDLLFFEVRVNS